jgi:hypothetical protein
MKVLHASQSCKLSSLSTQCHGIMAEVAQDDNVENINAARLISHLPVGA